MPKYKQINMSLPCTFLCKGVFVSVFYFFFSSFLPYNVRNGDVALVSVVFVDDHVLLNESEKPFLKITENKLEYKIFLWKFKF